MPIFDRPDGTHLAKVPALRKMMPHLMVGRNEAAVFFEQQIDLIGGKIDARRLERGGNLALGGFDLGPVGLDTLAIFRDGGFERPDRVVQDAGQRRILGR